MVVRDNPLTNTTPRVHRYSIFEMFDNVLLLGVGGQVVFQGKPKLVVPYFQDLGFSLPFGENPADWMLDISSGTLKAAAKAGREAVADTFEARTQFLFKTWKEHEKKLREDDAKAGEKDGKGESLREALDKNYTLGFLGQYVENAAEARAQRKDGLRPAAEARAQRKDGLRPSASSSLGSKKLPLLTLPSPPGTSSSWNGPTSSGHESSSPSCSTCCSSSAPPTSGP
jgi:hypothetical protein